MRIAHIASPLLTQLLSVSDDIPLTLSLAYIQERMEKRSEMPSLVTATTTSLMVASSSTSVSASISSSASHAASTSTVASTSSASSTSQSMPTMTLISSSSTGMPGVTTSSSATTTSISYTYQAAVPTNEASNPYISRPTLPANSVFIVFAGVVGLIGLSVLLSWLIVWLKSRKKAMTEKEVQYYQPFHYETGSNGSGAHLLSSSSQSSFMEKSSGSISSKFSDAVSLSLDTTTPGRSYIEMLSGMGRRNSMTISPVMEMMRSSASNLDLPLFNPAPEPRTDMELQYTEFVDRPVRRSRPPSVVLDDMLAAIEFSANYPESN